MALPSSNKQSEPKKNISCGSSNPPSCPDSLVRQRGNAPYITESRRAAERGNGRICKCYFPPATVTKDLKGLSVETTLDLSDPLQEALSQLVSLAA